MKTEQEMKNNKRMPDWLFYLLGFSGFLLVTSMILSIIFMAFHIINPLTSFFNNLVMGILYVISIVCLFVIPIGIIVFVLGTIYVACFAFLFIEPFRRKK